MSSHKQRPQARRPSRTRSKLWSYLVGGATISAVAALVVLAVQGGGSKSQGNGAGAAVLAESAEAPSVVLPSTTGRTVDLASYLGKRNVLLYFYEHAG